MLRLLLCSDWVAGRDEILRRVGTDIEKGLADRILMVPELISHDMERRLAALGDASSRYAQVLSFTRLARRVAEQVGSSARECLDNGGRVVAMTAAARQLHSRLKAYAAVQTRPEFLTQLVEAVDEFKRCCIGSQDLMAASHQTQGSLAQKLEELSLLLEGYDALCSRGKRDPRDQMNWLLEQLEAGDFGENHVFYIDGFPDFTRQHMAILAHLIRVSPEVTVCLNCDRVGSDSIAFETAGRTASQLLRIAAEAGVEAVTEQLPGREDPLGEMSSRLFQGKILSDPGMEEKISVYRAESVHQECLGAAARSLELIQKGVRYRDIGVVCTDLNTYRDAISLTFRRCGIPVYQSGTDEILHKTVIATVLSALEAALGGFSRRDVLRYLKSMLSPLDANTCDLVENYAITWGISGSRWKQPWQSHPDGLDGKWTEDAQNRLEELNIAKDMALAPLLRLQQGFRQATKLADQMMALYTFLEDIRLASRLDALARQLDESGDNRSAQILNQLWEILLSAMEQMYDVLGDTVWDNESFLRLFNLLLSCYDVGTIPPVLDSVTVGSVSAMRCHQVKHLILLGALEGALPGYGGANGVLSEQDRLTLRELGVPVNQGSMEGLQAEFAEIYGVFCGAGESVWVSCPAGQPSFVFRRLCQMAGQERQLQLSPVETITDPVDAAAYLYKEKAGSLAGELGIGESYELLSKRVQHDLGSIAPEKIQKLYGSSLRLSASQVDKQADCRLSYFLRYGLGAKERKEITVDPAEFGSYVHAVLEKTAVDVISLGGFRQMEEDQVLTIAHKHSDDYIAQRFSDIQSPRVKHLLSRNLSELEMIVRELWQEMHTSRFDPVGFEVAFGDGEFLPAIAMDGQTMHARLRGFVDRVDVWRENGVNYFRVVDYKTGKKTFDYCDVFNGLGLQMLLYMFALEQGGQKLLGDHPVSAGVQYFSARSPLISADGRMSVEEADAKRGSEWKRRGLVLAEDAVLEAMEPEGSPHRLSCKRRKDGTLTGDLANRQQLQMLKSYIFRLLGNMVDEIASGRIAPNPYTRGNSHDACRFCPYGAVCHPDTVTDRRNYQAMDSEEFWNYIEKEMRHG